MTWLLMTETFWARICGAWTCRNPLPWEWGRKFRSSDILHALGSLGRAGHDEKRTEYRTLTYLVIGALWGSQGGINIIIII